ncbi:MAG: hypothetical protein PHC35_09150 [Deltaproteobacteria bacterium]|jgi:metallophosphoesterase superfamily enzyme|nr:hypothetical protein [Deltaproteobacteria bacterium]
MSTGITLILDGSNSDLYSSLYATELAKRVGADIHAVLVSAWGKYNDTNGDSASKNLQITDPMASLKTVIRLGEYKHIKISSYMIENDLEEALVEFLKQRRIFCLITGANDESTAKEKKEWLDRLKIRLAQHCNSHFKPFWTLVATPWKDRVYYHMLERMELYRQKFN